MHELSIAQDILGIVRGNVPAPDLSKVRTIHLRIGVSAGVVVESLQFGFASLVSGTELERAALQVESVPFVLSCRNCGTVAGEEHGLALCPVCGGPDTEVVSGTELRVVAVDLLDADDDSGGPQLTLM